MIQRVEQLQEALMTNEVEALDILEVYDPEAKKWYWIEKVEKVVYRDSGSEAPVTILVVKRRA